MDTFGESSFVLWLLPAAVGVPVFQLWILYYKRKLEGGRAVTAKARLDLSA